LIPDCIFEITKHTFFEPHKNGTLVVN